MIGIWIFDWINHLLKCIFLMHFFLVGTISPPENQLQYSFFFCYLMTSFEFCFFFRLFSFRFKFSFIFRWKQKRSSHWNWKWQFRGKLDDWYEIMWACEHVSMFQINVWEWVVNLTMHYLWTCRSLYTSSSSSMHLMMCCHFLFVSSSKLFQEIRLKCCYKHQNIR